MNKVIGMHGLPHFHKQFKSGQVTVTGYNRIRLDDGLDELAGSALPMMRLAALTSVSAMVSLVLLVLYFVQH